MHRTNTRRSQIGWALYDWANAAFATTVMAGFFPIFFKAFWGAGQADQISTFQFGLGSALASLAVLLAAPLGGAIADRRYRRRMGILLFTSVAIAATAGLFWVPKGHWFWALLLFVIASIGYFMSIVFYDSLLVAVARPEQYDRLSALGYALGYLGGGLLFALNVAMVIWPASFGLADSSQAIRVSFLTAAFWWGLFAIPLFVTVSEPHASDVPPASQALHDGLKELAGTARDIVRQRQVWMFLLAYWLYIDGVHTIIRMAVDFGMNLGFSQNSLIGALLMVQFIGFPAAIVFGWLASFWDTKKALYLGLVVYTLITAWGYFLTSVWQFYVMAAAIGLVQGGVQSLSRSYFARLIPAGKAGEYFGVYNMMGKFAAVLGPGMVGMTAALTGSARLSIVTIVILFIAGGFLLTRVEQS